MFKFFPTFGNVGRILRQNVTRPGRALLFLLFFSSIGLIYLDSPLLYLFTTILSVLTLAALISLAFRPNIEFKIVAPDMAQAGKDVKADVYLTNLRARSAFEVFLENQGEKADEKRKSMEPAQVINVIRPKRTVREHLKLLFDLRGVYDLPSFSVGSTFPFNLFRFSQTKTPNQKVIVTPAFEPIHHFELPISNFSVDFENEKNVQLANALGSSEYVGNREYQEGMPVRRWDYPSWARTGNPTVREYRENQRGKATLFIDNFFDEPTEQNADFEALLSLATAISDALAKRQVEVGKLIIGNEIHTISESSQNEQIRSVAKILAMAEMQSEQEAESINGDLLVDELISNRGLPYLLFNKLSHERRRLFKLATLESGSCTAIVMDEKDCPVGMTSVSKSQISNGEITLR